MSSEKAIKLLNTLCVHEHDYATVMKAIALLESEPPAGEFTKEVRKQLESHKWSLPSRNQILEACDRIDRLEKTVESYVHEISKLEQANLELQKGDLPNKWEKAGLSYCKEHRTIHCSCQQKEIDRLEEELKAKNNALQSIADICFTRESKCYEMPCPCKELADQALKGDKP